jgi:hypothetical protein
MADYKQGLITTACQTYRLKTGRDLLLCEWDYHNMDMASQGIGVSDFSKEKDNAGGNVFEVEDTRPVCRPSAVWASIDKAWTSQATTRATGNWYRQLIVTLSRRSGVSRGAGKSWK